MLYSSAQDWHNAPRKKVLFFAMSGLGKTHISSMLRSSGDWYHYSVDYRIGTRYMGEYITDNAKAEAMKNPFLRELLLSDSIYIGSNITFHNLSPVASYLGKPGDVAKNGLPIDTYRKRQDQFRQSEISALMDTAHFIERAETLYQYPHFVCDTGGSICEWVDPEDQNDPILSELAKQTLMIWIEGSEDHTDELVRRFDAAPKPMSYQPQFLETCWREYLDETGGKENEVDPDAFIRWTYARALAHRQPRYAAMAKNWGLSIPADTLAAARDQQDFVAIVGDALAQRGDRA